MAKQKINDQISVRTHVAIILTNFRSLATRHRLTTNATPVVSSIGSTTVLNGINMSSSSSSSSSSRGRGRGSGRRRRRSRSSSRRRSSDGPNSSSSSSSSNSGSSGWRLHGATKPDDDQNPGTIRIMDAMNMTVTTATHNDLTSAFSQSSVRGIYIYIHIYASCCLFHSRHSRSLTNLQKFLRPSLPPKLEPENSAQRCSRRS